MFPAFFFSNIFIVTKILSDLFCKLLHVSIYMEDHRLYSVFNSGVSIKTFQNTRSPYRYKNGLLLPVIDVPLLLKTYLISRTLFLCRLRFFLII